jgi:type IV secretion system protein VirD4
MMPRIRPPKFRPYDVGWRLGRAGNTGPELWVPYDRTTCVIGPQGSGKTLDLLVPALLEAPGAALVTLTKPEDLFLTLQARQRDARPVAVLDPFDLAPGTPELVWDPIAGCEDSMLAERRAKAFAAGTIKGATAQGTDQAARFYAGECAKVLQAYFHAAAIAGLGLDDVLMWVANPKQHPQPEEILRTHPEAAALWDGLLRGALHGDDRTAGNTITTVQQSLALFFQGSIRRRCVPAPGRPATDLTDLIRAGGTIYLLGREDPYASASPMMTAVTEQILDTAKRLGETSEHGRLCPPFLACLDELPSTAPVPTLSTRMANERALGLSFILAAQTWRQFVVCYGEDEARTIYGLSNNLVVFGGGKDIHFYKELSDLLGGTTALRSGYTRSERGLSRSWNPSEMPILQPAELRRIGDGKALVLSETYDPIIASLDRCINGRRGAQLLEAQTRARLASKHPNNPDGSVVEDVARTAQRLGLPR